MLSDFFLIIQMVATLKTSSLRRLSTIPRMRLCWHSPLSFGTTKNQSSYRKYYVSLTFFPSLDHPLNLLIISHGLVFQIIRGISLQYVHYNFVTYIHWELLWIREYIVFPLNEWWYPISHNKFLDYWFDLSIDIAYDVNMFIIQHQQTLSGEYFMSANNEQLLAMWFS